MYYFILDAESVAATWAPVVIELLVAIAAIFGGAEYWKWKQAKLQAKLDKESKESGVEKKMDTVSDNVSDLRNTVSALGGKVDNLTSELQEIKDDILLLQKANEETVKYRELRDQQDKRAAKVQEAIIQSLMGILRERLVENYHRCMEKGYYTKEEREVYGKMYECYTQDPFNGNGVIHQLQPKMVALPWTAEEAKNQNRPSA